MFSVTFHSIINGLEKKIFTMCVDEHSDAYEVFNGALAGFLWLVSLFITSVHSFKVYQDLFTSERKSLAHRRVKPATSALYKKATYSTLITALLYCVCLMALAIQYNFSKGSCRSFVALTVILLFGMVGAKCFLYLTYILRLHQIYGNSAYEYRERSLVCCAVSVIIMGVASLFVSETLIFTDPIYYDDQDDVFPYFCSVMFDFSNDIAMLFVGVIGVYDIIMSVALTIAFVVPLNKVVKGVECNQKVNAQLLYSGYKYKVLVLVASVTTLAWIVFAMAEMDVISTILMLLDYVVNPICLLMMTPYYPNNIYYERLCCACTFCCDWKRRSYRSATVDKERDDGVVKTAKSLDTSQVLGDKLTEKSVETTCTVVSYTSKTEQIEQTHTVTPIAGTPALNQEIQ
eukprot:1016285_1